MNLRRVFAVLPIVVTLIAFLVPSAYAQGVGGGRMYNSATETTLSGTVEQVNTVSGRHGWQGTHIDLKTGSGTFDVHLGPSAYLKSKGFEFAKGDKVEVTGSKVSFQGHPAIIAREVKRDGKVLTLRNTQGIPEWSGARWRQR